MSKEFFVKAAAGFVAAVLTAGVASTAGCANKKPDVVNTVSGNLSYREPVKLSENAVAYVRLADVTKGQLNSSTVVQKTVKPDGDGSIPFALVYKEKDINPRNEYAVDVRVIDRGRLMYISDGKFNVITQGHGHNVDVALERPGGH